MITNDLGVAKVVVLRRVLNKLGIPATSELIDRLKSHLGKSAFLGNTGRLRGNMVDGVVVELSRILGRDPGKVRSAVVHANVVTKEASADRVRSYLESLTEEFRRTVRDRLMFSLHKASHRSGVVERSQVIEIFGDKDETWKQFFANPEEKDAPLVFKPNADKLIRDKIDDGEQRSALLEIWRKSKPTLDEIEEEVLEVAKTAFKDLGIEGINLYRVNRRGQIKCVSSNKMAGATRFFDWGKPEGAKAFVLQRKSGEKFFFLSDRFDMRAWGIGTGDPGAVQFFRQEEIKALRDAAAYKNGGTLEDAKKNVSQNVYVQIDAPNGEKYLFECNRHLANKEGKFKFLFSEIPGADESVGKEIGRELFNLISEMVSDALGRLDQHREQENYAKQLISLATLSPALDRVVGGGDEKDVSAGVDTLAKAVIDILPNILGSQVSRMAVFLADMPTEKEEEEGTKSPHLVMAASAGIIYDPKIEQDFGVAEWVVFEKCKPWILRMQGTPTEFPPQLREGGKRKVWCVGDAAIFPFKGKHPKVLGAISLRMELGVHLGEKEETLLQMIADILSGKLDGQFFLKELFRLATRDYLTGLYNRRIGLERLAEAFLKGNEQHKPVSVVAMDLDHFKIKNDTFGHTIGDRILIEATRRMECAAKAKVREILVRRSELPADEEEATALIDEICTVSRYGGEEFATILYDFNEQEALEVGEAERAVIAGAGFEVGIGQLLTQTASIGIASTAQANFRAPEKVYEAADAATYAAKDPEQAGLSGEGRNRVVLWKPGMKMKEQK
ncbi:MAG: diguanylate cyclase [Candidatus Saganbacteria bacterium]|nr:diguanylate cyclase [Candidatus Saganbacteria bacterium]